MDRRSIRNAEREVVKSNAATFHVAARFDRPILNAMVRTARQYAPRPLLNQAETRGSEINSDSYKEAVCLKEVAMTKSKNLHSSTA